MLTRFTYLTLLTLAFSTVTFFRNLPMQSDSPDVLGVATVRSDIEVLESTPTLHTKTSFMQKEIVEEEPIAFEIVYEKNNDLEYGLEEILEEGKEGAKVFTYQLTYWLDEELYRNLISTKIIEPITKRISKGNKVVWRTVATEYGEIKYWHKLKVWATKYDGNCEGCRGLTYSGTLVRKGVCAVDPKVISLGTNFYVEGYGMCRSEDIGGAIKGNKVDLGYEDVTKGEWRTGYTNVYLLTSYPTD